MDRTAPVEDRVVALQRLSRRSRWRHLVLRHDPKLWQHFPSECAAMQAEADLAAASLAEVEPATSTPQLHAPSLPQIGQGVASALAAFFEAQRSADTSPGVQTSEAMLQAAMVLEKRCRELTGAVSQQCTAARARLDQTREQAAIAARVTTVMQEVEATTSARVAAVDAAVRSGDAEGTLAGATDLRRREWLVAFASLKTKLAECKDLWLPQALMPETSRQVCRKAQDQLQRFQRNVQTERCLSDLSQVLVPSVSARVVWNADSFVWAPVQRLRAAETKLRNMGGLVEARQHGPLSASEITVKGLDDDATQDTHRRLLRGKEVVECLMQLIATLRSSDFPETKLYVCVVAVQDRCGVSLAHGSMLGHGHRSRAHAFVTRESPRCPPRLALLQALGLLGHRTQQVRRYCHLLCFISVRY